MGNLINQLLFKMGLLINNIIIFVGKIIKKLIWNHFVIMFVGKEGWIGMIRKMYVRM